MLVHHEFETTAARIPGKVALVCGERRLRYAELMDKVARLATHLRRDGVRPGDRVVLVLEGDVEYVIAIHAVLRAGAVFVPLPPTTRPDRLAFVLDDTGATALLAEVRLAPLVPELCERCATLRTVRLADRFDEPAGAPAEHASRIDEDLAAILYTSGSTGKPKGVMLSHLNMRSAWASVQAYIGFREDDVIGLALAPTFSYGLYHVLMGLGIGATVVLERQAAFAVKVVDTLAREAVTIFPAVPTLLASLLDHGPRDPCPCASLRIVTNAAAALPVALIDRIADRWPSASLFSMYGMTECKRISYLPPDELPRRPLSVGRGIPNQEHWLVDESGRRLDTDGTGELVVRGSHVMQGYWNRPEETAARLRPFGAAGRHALHTGDLFRTDSEGFLYFVSRMDDIIKTRGEKVAPREVEEAIHELRAVKSCAVVGVPDPRMGESVRAYVTLVQGAVLTEREVIRHCHNRLESYMVPKSVEFVESLPTTDSGKVRHAALRGG